MDNPVVIRAAEVAREARLATLRFNFRGVGASEGSHDKGRGEQDDVRAALATLRDRAARGRRSGWPATRSAPGCRAGSRGRALGLAALGLIAPPLGHVRLDFLGAGPAASPCSSRGTADPYCPVADLDRLAAARLGRRASRSSRARTTSSSASSSRSGRRSGAGWQAWAAA